MNIPVIDYGHFYAGEGGFHKLNVKQVNGTKGQSLYMDHSTRVGGGVCGEGEVVIFVGLLM